MALESRLQKGQLAFVLHTPPLPNRVRNTPSIQNSTVIGWIPPGVTMTLSDGPVEANGVLWWKVQSEGAKLTGWTSERDASNFFLGPIEERSLCTHAVRARLHKGDGVIVQGPTSIFARSMPGLEGAIIETLAPGSEFTLIGGPICLNGCAWWNVNDNQAGQTRWVAEGQAGHYLLAPLSVNNKGAVAGHYHGVQAGETWATLAQKFKITSTLLQSLNLGLKRPGLVLKPGDRMWIPGV